MNLDCPGGPGVKDLKKPVLEVCIWCQHWTAELVADFGLLFKFAVPFSSVQLLSRIRFFATPWTAAHQDSLSITNSQSSPKLMSIESVMPSSHLILCRPFLLLPSMFPSIRVFSSESVLHIRWPKYWRFSISPSNEYLGLISFMIDWFDFSQDISYKIQSISESSWFQKG